MSYRYTEGIQYFNLTDTNSDNAERPIRFQQDSILQFIQEPKKYNLGVVRFSIPMNLVPVNRIETIPNPLNPLDTTYTGFNISCSNGIDTFTENVTFVPDNINIASNNPEYYNYYDLTQFLDITNNALKLAYLDLQAVDGSFDINAVPFINYNYVTKLYELYVPLDDYNKSNPLQIFFNSSLNPYFQIPAVINPDSQLLYYNLTILNRTTNITTLYNLDSDADIKYLVMSSDVETKRNTIVQKIIIVGDYGLNTTSEFTGAPLSNRTPNNSTSSQNTITAITDFELDLEQNNSAWLQFQSSGVGNLRLVDFSAENGIQSFRISIYYQDLNNNIFPLRISRLKTATLKLAFVPKLYFLNDVKTLNS
jgi:hypothetical protein